MAGLSQTGPIEKRWGYLKNFRNDAKGISEPYLSRHDEDTEFHDHPSLTFPGFRFELAYVIEGEATHVTTNTEERVSHGDCILVDYGLRHAYKVKEGEHITVMNISFGYADIVSAPSRLRTLTEVAKYYSIITERDSSKPIERLIFRDENGKIYEAIEEIAREHREKRPGYMEIVRCKLLGILLVALRTYFCKNLPKMYSPPIQRIIDYMSYGYMSNIPLSDFARELGIPFRNLSRLFIKETGMPYTRYVQHRKIAEGCNLLLKSDESIEFISEYVGFSDSKMFRTRFKEQMGMTPREYRRLYSAQSYFEPANK